MNLILINPQSNQQIPLDRGNPFIIGRNNVVGCSDKKVSRNHGRITCTENGKINLVALHSNPCFFMKDGVPPIRQLNKDEEQILNEGDCLGLLPDSFWFQISSKNMTIKKEANNESNSDSETTNLENIKENKPNIDETQNSGFSTVESSDYSKRIGSPEFEKTRRLPLSMYETDEIMTTGKSSYTRDNSIKMKKQKLDDTDCVNPKTDLKNNQSDNEGKDKEKPSTSKNFVGDTANESKTEEKTDHQEAEEAKPDRTMKRPTCKYEHNCYRKNPQHKIKFCHPGDSDYVPYERRPFCHYGEACCGRNKTHRHGSAKTPDSSLNSASPSSRASSPLPLKRRRKKLTQNSECEDEDENEGDELEDPFENDASSDEYVPTDLNSEDDLDESQEI